MPIVLISKQERLQVTYEGATIFFHRLLQEERAKVTAKAVQRGTILVADEILYTCQEAIDGWDAEIYDADMQPLPVPPAGESQREQIAELVRYFPAEVLRLVYHEAWQDAPDEIKKRWHAHYPDALSSWTDAAATSLPAMTADSNGERTTSPFPATPEG